MVNISYMETGPDGVKSTDAGTLAHIKESVKINDTGRSQKMLHGNSHEDSV